MRKLYLAIPLLLCLSSAVHSSGSAGYPGAFLRNGTGARPLGMGGAFTAVAEGAETVYYNPGGLGYITNIDFTSSYKTLSLDRHFGFIAVSLPIRNEATMAASWVNAGVSDVIGRGNSRQILGEIGNSSNAFALSFGKALHERFSFGANLRYVQEKLDDLETFTIGFDMGVLGRPHEFVSLGAIIQNLGSSYRWESSKYWSEGTSYEESFPLVAKFGAAGRLLSGRLIPAIDLETSDKSEIRFRAGVEYWFTKKVVRQVEDEYEEDVFIDVEENVRQAGLRIGLDRGSPTFGFSLMSEFRKVSFGFEYAFLVGRQGTSSGHLFTLNLGY
jgi:hypothetical protein